TNNTKIIYGNIPLSHIRILYMCGHNCSWSAKYMEFGSNYSVTEGGVSVTNVSEKNSKTNGRGNASKLINRFLIQNNLPPEGIREVSTTINNNTDTNTTVINNNTGGNNASPNTYCHNRLWQYLIILIIHIVHVL